MRGYTDDERNCLSVGVAFLHFGQFVKSCKKQNFCANKSVNVDARLKRIFVDQLNSKFLFVSEEINIKCNVCGLDDVLPTNLEINFGCDCF